ncbi:MAG: transcriptional regulator NrdR [Bdellovibrionales bacterium GWA2_49_15]|nr:MAG: transcriptional regulator NrdR [Bdellovibrionales bacterium GWA2_49_15]HAZ12099.1 transcriptional regulator NrdR [Bdellovibrionales bacterium]
MHCPKCQANDTKVIDSRHFDLGSAVRRRRRCEVCQYRFTTYEQIEMELPTIVKNDGRREVFGREKIMNGLLKSCQKRPIPVEELNTIADRIEMALAQAGHKEILSKDIGLMVMEELKKLDPVAYVRFASFYWNFDDVESFVSGLTSNYTNAESLN